MALFLVLKTAQLQIFDSKYRDQAKRATLYNQTLFPARGIIYDRNNKLLVANDQVYDLEVVYRNIDSKMDTAQFCELLGITREYFIENTNKDWSNPRFHKSVPYTFLGKIRTKRFAKFKEHIHKFPGFFPVLKNIRSYPHQSAAHALGYLSEVDRNDIGTSNGEYVLGDYHGDSGLEKSYENFLRGTKGVAYIMKDNLGRKVGEYDNGNLDSSAVAGVNFRSSIDLDIQAYGESLLVNKRGSIVAIEPSTGEILAIISAPNYNPNDLSIGKGRGQSYANLLSDTTNRPLLDRSISAIYPPGSIFKCVMSLIAMQQDVCEPNRTIYCDGAYEIGGGAVQRCHNHPTPYNISTAIQYSCNSYYYQLMRDMVNKYGYTNPGEGLDTLVSHLRDFGLGSKLGVDLNYENDGFIPDSKFYDNLYRREVNGWRATYMLSLGIGQGELEVTTLQMANLATIMANRGHFYTPHLMKNILSPNLQIDGKYRIPKHVRIDQKYFPYVIDGMEMAVRAGTATSAFLNDIQVCGKTGTSENPFGKDHSVFFGFAPKDNPKIAIAAFVENAGFGASFATPIASLIMEKYLTDTIRTSRKWVEERMINSALIERPEEPILTELIN